MLPQAYLEVMPLWLLHSRTQALVFDCRRVGLDLTGIGGLQFSDMGHTGLRGWSEISPDANEVTLGYQVDTPAYLLVDTEQGMDNKEKDVSEVIQGVTPVDPKALEDFKREMTTTTSFQKFFGWWRSAAYLRRRVDSGSSNVESTYPRLQHDVGYLSVLRRRS